VEKGKGGGNASTDKGGGKGEKGKPPFSEKKKKSQRHGGKSAGKNRTGPLFTLGVIHCSAEVRRGKKKERGKTKCLSKKKRKDQLFQKKEGKPLKGGESPF